MKMYYIAIVLPEHLDAMILRYKQMIQERFQAVVGLKSPAHLTLIPPFWMDEKREPELMKDMKEVAGHISEFEIMTNDFACFKPRTIYIAVQPSDRLLELKQIAEDQFSGGTYKIKRENRPFHPHITIATRDLKKHQFAEAWDLFKKKGFQKVFTAGALSLLRHNGKGWDVISTVNFHTSLEQDDAWD